MPIPQVPDGVQEKPDPSLANEHGSFDAIVRTYERRVYNLACQMLGDPEEARDATQEIFLRVHQNLESYSEISDVLGVTEGTVASRLNAARSTLARRLRHLRPSGGTRT